MFQQNNNLRCRTGIAMARYMAFVGSKYVSNRSLILVYLTGEARGLRNIIAILNVLENTEEMLQIKEKILEVTEREQMTA